MDKWAGLENNLWGHAFSFASRYAGGIRTRLAFGSESNSNSNCSRLAWSASSLGQATLDAGTSASSAVRLQRRHAANASEMYIKYLYTTR